MTKNAQSVKKIGVASPLNVYKSTERQEKYIIPPKINPSQAFGDLKLCNSAFVFILFVLKNLKSPKIIFSTKRVTLVFHDVANI